MGLNSHVIIHSRAEVEEQPFKDKHRPGAAEDRQGLSGQQTEHGPRQGCSQEALQHALQHSSTLT